MREQETTLSRDSFLDVLRGIAILGVILVHSGASANAASLEAGGQGVPPMITGITDLGRFGVQLFFLLSGWLLESLYGSEKHVFSRKKFLVRRIARIYPLWLVFLAAGFVLPNIGISTGIQQLLKAPNDGSWKTALLIISTAVTFTLWVFPSFWNTVIPGGWSIQAEVGHYLLFPMIRRLSISKIILGLAVLRLVTGGLYFASQALHNSLFTEAVSAWLRLGLYNSLLFFVGGIFIERWRSGNWLVDKKATFATLLLFVSILVNADGFGEELQKIGFIGLALAGAWLVTQSSALKQLFVRVGNYSYFIYFCHFVGLSVFDLIVRQSGWASFISKSSVYAILLIPGYLLFSLSFAYVLGILSWRYLESPVIRLSRKIQ